VSFVRFCLTIAVVGLQLLLERSGHASAGLGAHFLVTPVTIWAVTPWLLELSGRWRYGLGLLGLGLYGGAVVYGVITAVRLEQFRRCASPAKRYSWY
jgi:hypothetical protein